MVLLAMRPDKETATDFQDYTLVAIVSICAHLEGLAPDPGRLLALMANTFGGLHPADPGLSLDAVCPTSCKIFNPPRTIGQIAKSLHIRDTRKKQGSGRCWLEDGTGEKVQSMEAVPHLHGRLFLSKIHCLTMKTLLKSEDKGLL